MHLKIQTENDVYNQYINYSTYHEGSGFILQLKITLEPKETKIISLGIRWSTFRQRF